jgi:hypothetical protein
MSIIASENRFPRCDWYRKIKEVDSGNERNFRRSESGNLSISENRTANNKVISAISAKAVRAALSKNGIISTSAKNVLICCPANNYIIAAIAVDIAGGNNVIMTAAAIDCGFCSVVDDEIVAGCCRNGASVCRFPSDGCAINNDSPYACTAAAKT